MKKVFADTGYWIALLNPKDELHEKAKVLSAQLGQFHTVTSQLVMTEALNYFSAMGPSFRKAASLLVEKVQNDPNSTLVPQTSVQFSDSRSLYQQHEDKEWSLTDCASILIMRGEGIRECLTYDHHFAQAGFTPLLR